VFDDREVFVDNYLKMIQLVGSYEYEAY
jgi:hypothetical protein